MGISICERKREISPDVAMGKGFPLGGTYSRNCRFRSVHPWRLCGGTCDRKAGEVSCRKHDTQSAPRVIHNGSFQHVIKWLFSSIFCRCGSWIRTPGPRIIMRPVRRCGRGIEQRFRTLHSQAGPAPPVLNQHRTARRFELLHFALRCEGEWTERSRTHQSATGVPRRFTS